MTDASTTPTEPPAGHDPAVSGTSTAPSMPLMSRPLGVPARPTSTEPADVTRTLTLPEDVAPVTLLGARDEVLRAIEKGFTDVDIHVRGTAVTVSGPAARVDGHLVRHRADAVMIGTRTALTDDPSLDARRSDGSRFTKQPLRVVMGRREIPESYRIRGLAAEGPYDPDRFLQVFTHDPFELLSTLYDRGVRHLMIEGGPGMVGLFAGEDLVDEMIWCRAPLLLGHGKSAVYRLSTGTLANAPRLHLDDLGMFPAVRVLGADTATHLVPVPRGDYQNPGARRILERCTECYAPEPREDG